MRNLILIILFFSTPSFADCQSRLNRKRSWSLTRDLMPEIFKREGSLVEVRKATPKEYQRLLIKKFDEEVDEFNREPSAEELADVKEVVLTIAKYLGTRKEHDQFLEEKFREYGFDEAEVERVRLAKRAKKGGFTAGYIIRAIPARQRRLNADF